MTIEFFYIIKHKQSNRKYAGCNPSDLFTTYFTSSPTIHSIIKSDGIESFEIEEIITEFGEFKTAYNYETNFLISNNCAKSEEWINSHNNTIILYGTQQFKDCCEAKYGKGIVNPFQAKVNQDKVRSTVLKKYNCENVFQNEEIKELIKNVVFERYGVDNIAKLPKNKAISKSNMLNLQTIRLSCIYCRNATNLGNFKRWHGDNCKENLNNNKKEVKLYFLDMCIKVKLISNEFALLIEQGWNTKRTAEDYTYIRSESAKRGFLNSKNK